MRVRLLRPAAALAEPGFRHDELGLAVTALEHVVDRAAVVPRQQPEALELLERNAGRAAGAVAQIAGGLADRGHHQVAQPVPKAPLLGAEHVQGEHQHPHCRQDGPAGIDRPQQGEQDRDGEGERERRDDEPGASLRAFRFQRGDLRRDLALEQAPELRVA